MSVMYVILFYSIILIPIIKFDLLSPRPVDRRRAVTILCQSNGKVSSDCRSDVVGRIGRQLKEPLDVKFKSNMGLLKFSHGSNRILEANCFNHMVSHHNNSRIENQQKQESRSAKSTYRSTTNILAGRKRIQAFYDVASTHIPSG
jgi:hypothetical protein